MIHLLTILCLLLGALLILTAAIGVVRLPDVLCRSHAVAKALTLGIFLMLLGLWLQLEDPRQGLKIVLAIFFQVLTIPVSSHLIGLISRQEMLHNNSPLPSPSSPSDAKAPQA
ncbi:MAG: monovalent cation/H(+) antiporter subunit G [Verrucomicrobiae bacterium]|nr:monovalent cation/H(+) antiporter subunit G [Verrucomicrobiae bacterium]